VLEVVEDWRSNSYRAVYTVRYAARVVRAACFSEEIEVWYRNPETGPGSDQEQIESGRQARQGAG
jgi:hypothetical protein